MHVDGGLTQQTQNISIVPRAKNTARAVPILTKDIHLAWPMILPWAEEFCQHSQGSYDPPFILKNLATGAMQAWLMQDGDQVLGVTLTEVRQTVIRELTIIICTGKQMESWHFLTSALEKYAKAMGCQKLCGVARPGWEKILQPSGWKKTHVFLEKML